VNCYIVEPSTSGATASSSATCTLYSSAEAASEPQDEREDIKRKFFVEMPQDFYDFWEFAKTVNTKSPSGQLFSVIMWIL